MREKFLLDTNIIIRMLTKDPEKLFKQAVQLMEQLGKREVSFYVPSMVIAETCWTLQSFYHFTKQDIGKTLQVFLESEEVELEESWVMNALDDFITHNVDFIDAYLSHKANKKELGIITWNKKHFKRLDCEFYTPGDLINP